MSTGWARAAPLVTLVAGLPASGKSTWAALQADKLRRQGIPCEVLDDPESLAAVDKAISAAQQRAGQVFITDPALCDDRVLQQAVCHLKYRGAAARVVHFQNDPAACLRNAQAASRKDKPVQAYIQLLTKNYNPPSGALPVWQG